MCDGFVFALFSLFVCAFFLYLSSPPPLGRRKKEACVARIGTPSVEGLLYCSSLSMLPFWLSTTKTFVLTAFLHFTAVPTHISPPSIAMAEMADLATALDKLEVTKKREESPPDSSAQQTKEASPQASSSSPPASAEKQEEKESEKSPPASNQQEEKKKPEDSPQPHEEEVTLKVGSGAASEDPSPPESKKPEDSKDPSPPDSKKPEDSKDPSPPEPKPQDSAEDDLLEFTSATEGEGEASSSAWELVPHERRIARKKDSEIDSLVKKVIKEAEQPAQAQVTSENVTSSSAKDVVASIPEDPAAEAAEEQGT